MLPRKFGRPAPNSPVVKPGWNGEGPVPKAAVLSPGPGIGLCCALGLPSGSDAGGAWPGDSYHPVAVKAATRPRIHLFRIRRLRTLPRCGGSMDLGAKGQGDGL